DAAGIEPASKDDDGEIGEARAEVAVTIAEGGDGLHFVVVDALNAEQAIDEILQKGAGRSTSNPSLEQVVDLGDRKLREHQVFGRVQYETLDDRAIRITGLG